MEGPLKGSGRPPGSEAQEQRIVWHQTPATRPLAARILAECVARDLRRARIRRGLETITNCFSGELGVSAW